ncbi:CD1845 family protein [Christensenellaceae bacterium OttesenSCG-928-L17]|nr:CD1845 family protein [Christensenellaceae bacterium OttesenSCG-928-L17]
MRIIVKILLFPVILALSIIVALGRLLCLVSGAILNTIAFVILVIAFLTVVMLGEPIWTGLKMAGLAWLISSFGLPLIVTFLVELLGAAKDSIKAI